LSGREGEKERRKEKEKGWLSEIFKLRGGKAMVAGESAAALSRELAGEKKKGKKKSCLPRKLFGLSILRKKKKRKESTAINILNWIFFAALRQVGGGEHTERRRGKKGEGSRL